MGRIRTLKPEFFRSRSLSRCSLGARVTFQGLWCEADDYGRGIADPRLIKGLVWALDDGISVADVSDHMIQLETTGHISTYEVEGDRYYEVTNWSKHQSSSHTRGNPIYPPNPEREDNVPQREDNVPREGQREGFREERAPDQARLPLHADACKKVQEQGTGRREQGEGNEEQTVPAAPVLSLVPDLEAEKMRGFDKFWEVYPKRNGKKNGRARAVDYWRKMSLKDKRAAYRGAVLLAKAVDENLTLAKDPPAFLNQRAWEDWQEPAIADRPVPSASGDTHRPRVLGRIQ